MMKSLFWSISEGSSQYDIGHGDSRWGSLHTWLTHVLDCGIRECYAEMSQGLTKICGTHNLARLGTESTRYPKRLVFSGRLLGVFGFGITPGAVAAVWAKRPAWQFGGWPLGVWQEMGPETWEPYPAAGSIPFHREHSQKKMDNQGYFPYVKPRLYMKWPF